MTIKKRLLITIIILSVIGLNLGITVHAISECSSYLQLGQECNCYVKESIYGGTIKYFSIPSNGYVTIIVSESSDGHTAYWGLWKGNTNLKSGSSLSSEKVFLSVAGDYTLKLESSYARTHTVRVDFEAYTPTEYCGDGSCNGGETCSSCSSDCGTCPVSAYCGDGSCNGGETCSSCSQDCGSCSVSAYCGDGSCNNGETCSTCSSDCGTCQSSEYCGNGYCGSGENCDKCPGDCGICNRRKGELCRADSHCESGLGCNWLGELDFSRYPGVCCKEGEKCCSPKDETFTDKDGSYVCGEDYYLIKTGQESTTTSEKKALGEACNQDSECEYTCKEGRCTCTDCDADLECDVPQVPCYQEQETFVEEKSGVCTFGGDARLVSDCIVGIISEMNPVWDMTQIFYEIGCDVIPKFVEAITNLDPSSHESIKQSRIKINEATGKTLMLMADIADWIVLPLKAFELIGCIDDKFTLSGKAIDFMAESVAEVLWQEKGKTSTIAILHSPGNLLVVTDRKYDNKEGDWDDGKFVGYDKDGNFKNEVEGAVYKHLTNSDTKIVFVPNTFTSEDSNVHVIVYATGKGSADLTRIDVSKDGMRTYREFNDIPLDIDAQKYYVGVSEEWTVYDKVHVRSGVGKLYNGDGEDISFDTGRKEEAVEYKILQSNVKSSKLWIWILLIILIIVILVFFGYKNKKKITGIFKSKSKKV